MIGAKSATNRLFVFFFFRISRTNPSKKHFLASLCVSGFLGLELGWANEGIALQYLVGAVGGDE